MTSLITTMKKEQEYLEQVKCKAEEDIRENNKYKLSGKLRIHKKGNSVQYYHSETEKPTEDKTNPFTKDKSNQDNQTKQHQTYIPKKKMN